MSHIIMSRRISALITTFLAFTLISFSQHKGFPEKLSLLTETIQKNHYHPRAIDDEFSQYVYEDMLKRIDNNCVLFSNEDIQKLSTYKDQIDDLIINKDTAYIHLLNELFYDKITRTINFLEEEINQSHEWMPGDSIKRSDYNHFSPEKIRSTKWQKLIRYQTLKSLENQSDTSSVSEPNDQKAKQSTINKYLCRFTKVLNSSGGTAGYIHRTFLESTASAFDPHTMYFSALESNYFLTDLSKEKYSFGLYLHYNEFGQIEVSELTPGGPAWKSNKINVGDVVLNIEYDDKKINLNCASIEPVENVFISDLIAEANFKIRKKSGTEVTVKLKKSILDVEDNIIQSFILEGSKKIGYIYLPSFYSDYNEYNTSNGCSDDIAKEILRLKKAGIEGLIFDVRNNGGGDVEEALKLAGIFINHGALAIVDVKDASPGTLNDRNRGTLYSAPLLILQNKLSASASELLAGTLQDYNRAIIVGSNSYGKATTQNIVPLSSGSSAPKDNPGLVKVTTGKFFRVDGSSHQNTGVVPDIHFPDLSAGDSIGEHAHLNSLSKQKIDKKAYYYPLDSLPRHTLKNLSSVRIKSDTCFTNLQKLSSTFRDSYISIPLSDDEFDNYFKTLDEIHSSHRINPTDTEIIYSVNSLNSVYGIISSTEDSEDATESIEEDIYIKESYNIITDLIRVDR
jgi:carboxyl-terminal processing protease